MNLKTHDTTDLSPEQFERLLDDLSDKDPNTRIEGIRHLAATSQRFTEKQQEQASAELLYLLRDEATDDYMYSGFVADEEAPQKKVCTVAAVGLKKMGYADTLPLVVEKARRNGYPVKVTFDD